MNQQRNAPVSITSATSGRSDDIRRRQIKYLVSMGVRTVCFLLAIVLPSPIRWLMVFAAVFLPYFAVVVANAADGRRAPGPPQFVPEDRPQIAATRWTRESFSENSHPPEDGVG
jgi:hypothetical protein